MNREIILLTLVSVFSLSAMIVTSPAQTRKVGVSEGDWFKYGDISFDWSSNDPNATISDPEWNETEWMMISILDVSGTNINGQKTVHYKNGTEETSGGYVDIDTGDGENFTSFIISADLEENDAIYTSGYYSNLKINETIVRTYPDGVRNTNHLNTTMEDHEVNGTEIYYYQSLNYYWDQSTGVLVEIYWESLNQTGEYVTTASESIRITDSNIWVIPEFPTSTSILILLVVLTSTIAICKRRLLKTPTH